VLTSRRHSQRWEVVTPAQLGIITFRFAAPHLSPREVDLLTQRAVEDLIRDGFGFLRTTLLRGRVTLRMCTINPATQEAELDEVLRRLEGFWVARIEALG
jgi:aromatic-L-amino-acid decarboxylase